MKKFLATGVLVAASMVVLGSPAQAQEYVGVVYATMNTPVETGTPSSGENCVDYPFTYRISAPERTARYEILERTDGSTSYTLLVDSDTSNRTLQANGTYLLTGSSTLPTLCGPVDGGNRLVSWHVNFYNADGSFDSQTGSATSVGVPQPLSWSDPKFSSIPAGRPGCNTYQSYVSYSVPDRVYASGRWETTLTVRTPDGAVAGTFNRYDDSNTRSGGTFQFTMCATGGTTVLLTGTLSLRSGSRTIDRTGTFSVNVAQPDPEGHYEYATKTLHLNGVRTESRARNGSCGFRAKDTTQLVIDCNGGANAWARATWAFTVPADAYNISKRVEGFNLRRGDGTISKAWTNTSPGRWVFTAKVTRDRKYLLQSVSLTYTTKTWVCDAYCGSGGGGGTDVVWNIDGNERWTGTIDAGQSVQIVGIANITTTCPNDRYLKVRFTVVSANSNSTVVGNETWPAANGYKAFTGSAVDVSAASKLDVTVSCLDSDGFGGYGFSFNGEVQVKIS